MKQFKNIPTEDIKGIEEPLEATADNQITIPDNEEKAESNTPEQENSATEIKQQEKGETVYMTLEEALDANTEPYEQSERESIAKENHKEEGKNFKDTVYSGSWPMFLDNLKKQKSQAKTNKKRLCHIDVSIAMALDECEIEGASREMKINAILITFIKSHIEQLKECRKGVSYFEIITGES